MAEDGTIITALEKHILTITVDREDKMNSFTPQMFDQLSDAMTQLESDDDAWVGVLTFKGKHTTAGLDLPKFAASMRDGSRDASAETDDRVDAFALRRRCSKPVIMAVQGVCYTIGIEMMLGVDIVVAADNARFCQLEPKRGLAVFGGAHVRYVQRAGWGNAMYHLLRADEFDAKLGRCSWVLFRRWCRRVSRLNALSSWLKKSLPVRRWPFGKSNGLRRCFLIRVNGPVLMKYRHDAPGNSQFGRLR